MVSKDNCNVFGSQTVPLGEVHRSGTVRGSSTLLLPFLTMLRHERLLHAVPSLTSCKLSANCRKGAAGGCVLHDLYVMMYVANGASMYKLNFIASRGPMLMDGASSKVLIRPSRSS